MENNTKLTQVELRAAINFGNNTIEEYENRKKTVPTFLYKRLIELYEELTESLSLGID